jgi:hypothetical protein
MSCFVKMMENMILRRIYILRIIIIIIIIIIILTFICLRANLSYDVAHLTVRS